MSKKLDRKLIKADDKVIKAAHAVIDVLTEKNEALERMVELQNNYISSLKMDMALHGIKNP